MGSGWPADRSFQRGGAAAEKGSIPSDALPLTVSAPQTRGTQLRELRRGQAISRLGKQIRGSSSKELIRSEVLKRSGPEASGRHSGPTGDASWRID